MKKLILIGITVGIAGLAQAVTISLPSSISGPKAYIFQTAVTLDPNLTYTGASITFNNVTFTQQGGNNTFYYDLLNGAYTPQTITDNGANNETVDYFQYHTPYSTRLDVLGNMPFDPPSWQFISGHWVLVDDTKSWTTTFSAQALSDILADINTYGYFDLGFDPNCTYEFDGTVTVDFTAQATPRGGPAVPDHAMTVYLLGMSFLGMMVVRRKLALN